MTALTEEKFLEYKEQYFDQLRADNEIEFLTYLER